MEAEYPNSFGYNPRPAPASMTLFGLKTQIKTPSPQKKMFSHLTVLVFSSPLTSTIPPQTSLACRNPDQNNGKSQQKLNQSAVFYFYNNNTNIADNDYVIMHVMRHCATLNCGLL